MEASWPSGEGRFEAPVGLEGEVLEALIVEGVTSLAQNAMMQWKQMKAFTAFEKRAD